MAAGDIVPFSGGALPRILSRQRASRCRTRLRILDPIAAFIFALIGGLVVGVTFLACLTGDVIHGRIAF